MFCAKIINKSLYNSCKVMHLIALMSARLDTPCLIGYVLIIRRANEYPICAVTVKNQSEIFINVLIRKARFHK